MCVSKYIRGVLMFKKTVYQRELSFHVCAEFNAVMVNCNVVK